MRVRRVSTIDELEQLAHHWNGLAQGVPFRTWQWLLIWWRHYQSLGKLYTLTVHDQHDALVGLAPWYLAQSAARGRVLRMLGSGDVCSDYLTLLSKVEHTDTVSCALADWLTVAANRAGEDRWDILELEGIDAADRSISILASHLAGRGCRVHRRAGLACWRIELPDCWNDYLAILSKSHRKQLRKCERRLLDSDRVVLRTAASHAEVERGLAILVDLHTRRRRSLNTPGCFACPRFTRFLYEAVDHLWDAHMAQLHWLEINARPVAVELHLSGERVVYAYQSGIEPEALADEPGRLLTMATLQQAMTRGMRGFDFLRGNEPYKNQWRAQPRASVELRIAANRTVSQLRHGVWLASHTMKHWIKNGFSSTGSR